MTNESYPALPVGANGGYPDWDTINYSSDPAYPAPLEGSADTFKRELDTTPIAGNPEPLFPGQAYLSYNPHFGRIDRQLVSDPAYPAYIGDLTLDRITTAGVSAHAVDSWNLHPGDVNLQEGYWDATSGAPRQNSDLVAAGPVNGRPLSAFSGFIAMLRLPSAGQPGPVAGRIGADATASIQAANAEVQWATQVSDAALNNSIFGAI